MGQTYQLEAGSPASLLCFLHPIERLCEARFRAVRVPCRAVPIRPFFRLTDFSSLPFQGSFVQRIRNERYGQGCQLREVPPLEVAAAVNRISTFVIINKHLVIGGM